MTVARGSTAQVNHDGLNYLSLLSYVILRASAQGTYSPFIFGVKKDGDGPRTVMVRPLSLSITILSVHFCFIQKDTTQAGSQP